MPRYRARFQMLADSEFDAPDAEAAKRRADFMRRSLPVTSSKGEVYDAPLYSIEEIKNESDLPDIPGPQPQRQFVA